MSEVEKLGELDFTIEAISDFSELEGLVPPRDLEAARERGEERYRRYIDKMRGRIPPDGRAKARGFFMAEAYLEAYLKAASARLGLGGEARRDCRKIALSILRRLRKLDPKLWPQFLYGLCSMWIGLTDLDPKLVRMVAMLTAKVFYRLEYGGLGLEGGGATHAGEGVGEPRA